MRSVESNSKIWTPFASVRLNARMTIFLMTGPPERSVMYMWYAYGIKRIGSFTLVHARE
jgi:hypothetical protein